MLGSSRRGRESMRVTVVVLGDLGRSPRMQYHAEALAAHQIDVDVVARAGSAPIAQLRGHPRITCHLLPPAREGSLPARAAGAGRGGAGRRADTPTSVPVPDRVTQARRDPGAEPAGHPDPAGGARRRPAARRAPGGGLAQLRLDGARAGARPPPSRRRRSRAGSRPPSAAAPTPTCACRRRCGDDLQARWRIRPVTVFRDRPAERFAPLTAEARRARRRRLFDTLGVRRPGAGADREPDVVDARRGLRSPAGRGAPLRGAGSSIARDFPTCSCS